MIQSLGSMLIKERPRNNVKILHGAVNLKFSIATGAKVNFLLYVVMVKLERDECRNFTFQVIENESMEICNSMRWLMSNSSCSSLSNLTPSFLLYWFTIPI